jgi:hypothetical protein
MVVLRPECCAKCPSGGVNKTISHGQGYVAPVSTLLKEIGKRPSLFLKFFSPDPPPEEGAERIYSLPWQPVLETFHIRVVKRALVNNRNQENEIKKVSSTPHSLIVTEIPELRPVLHKESARETEGLHLVLKFP